MFYHFAIIYKSNVKLSFKRIVKYRQFFLVFLLFLEIFRYLMMYFSWKMNWNKPRQKMRNHSECWTATKSTTARRKSWLKLRTRKWRLTGISLVSSDRRLTGSPVIIRLSRYAAKTLSLFHCSHFAFKLKICLLCLWYKTLATSLWLW